MYHLEKFPRDQPHHAIQASFLHFLHNSVLKYQIPCLMIAGELTQSMTRAFLEAFLPPGGEQ